MTTTAQHPLSSGFSARSTATEVLAGIDLTGRTAMVAALHAAGARVIVPARRPEVAGAALAARGLSAVEVETLDLADLVSVRALAERFLATGRSIDILINNAAVMASPETRVGDGWESQFATNHLGHFVLTNLLWPALTADGGARVVALSSTGHKLSGIRFDDPQFTAGYDKWQAYGQAKTANSLFAVQLDVLGAGHGVRAFAVHPGGIMTELQRHLPREEMITAGWMTEDGVVNAQFKSPEQGAATSVWAATSRLLDGKGGVYCEDCDIADPTEPGSASARVRGVNPHAIDPDAAARLWALSAELTGVNAFA
jgi:NAD(P)-dependent dehydrogenase (short-subunit alcohol dehydrogenase family)